MTPRFVRTLLFALVAIAGELLSARDVAPASTLRPDPPIVCERCDAWNTPQAPFRVFGNTYYVGTAQLGSVLIVSDAGLVLLDGALPQSAPLIDANIRRLGFQTEAIKLIVTSHTHFDHVGGVAAFQRATSAEVAASAASARALSAGAPTADDPQFAYHAGFPRVKRVRVIADGDTLRVGNVAITAHATPGHTPGGTTWTWKACDVPRCLDIVYADSLTAVSAPEYRFSAHPDALDAFRRSIRTVAALPCDILLSVHPEFSDMAGKLARRAVQADPDPFVDPSDCRTYAAGAERQLGRRLDEER
jgi:metallo-beta-lactamase class B